MRYSTGGGKLRSERGGEGREKNAGNFDGEKKKGSVLFVSAAGKVTSDSDFKKHEGRKGI